MVRTETKLKKVNILKREMRVVNGIEEIHPKIGKRRMGKIW